MNKALKAFRECRSIKHSADIFILPRTCPHRRIIAEGNATLYSSLVTRIVRLTEAVMVLFIHWLSGEWD
jgi:hypothetical protein